MAGDGVAGDGVAGNGAMGQHDADGSVLGLLLRKSLRDPPDCQQHAYTCEDFIRASPPRTCPCGATCDDRSRLEGFVIRTSHSYRKYCCIASVHENALKCCTGSGTYSREVLCVMLTRELRDCKKGDFVVEL